MKAVIINKFGDLGSIIKTGLDIPRPGKMKY